MSAPTSRPPTPVALPGQLDTLTCPELSELCDELDAFVYDGRKAGLIRAVETDAARRARIDAARALCAQHRR